MFFFLEEILTAYEFPTKSSPPPQKKIFRKKVKREPISSGKSSSGIISDSIPSQKGSQIVWTNHPWISGLNLRLALGSLYLRYIRKKKHISEVSLEATSRLPCLDPSEESHPNLLRTSPRDTPPVEQRRPPCFLLGAWKRPVLWSGDSEWIYDMYINICIHVTIYIYVKKNIYMYVNIWTFIYTSIFKYIYWESKLAINSVVLFFPKKTSLF